MTTYFRIINGETYGEDDWSASDALDNCLDARKACEPFEIFERDIDGFTDVTEDTVIVYTATADYMYEDIAKFATLESINQTYTKIHVNVREYTYGQSYSFSALELRFCQICQLPYPALHWA